MCCTTSYSRKYSMTGGECDKIKWRQKKARYLWNAYTTKQGSERVLKDQSRSCGGCSPFDSRPGPEERRDPIVIDPRERGEYSAESLRSDDEYGEGGNCSDG